MRMDPDNVKAVMFDLDGTLSRSKVPIDREMAALLAGLTRKKKVAIISGAKFGRFRAQILGPIKESGAQADLKDLFIFPNDGAALFCYHRGRWREVYEKSLTPKEIKDIEKDFRIALKATAFAYPRHDHGPLIESRKASVTFSALGQRTPLREKERWHLNRDTRRKISEVLKAFLPGFEVDIAGLTSIDVMRKGVNKGYALMKMAKILRVPLGRIFFVGDAIFPGGNDYPAKKTGVPCFKVSGPNETKRIIRKLLS